MPSIAKRIHLSPTAAAVFASSASGASGSHNDLELKTNGKSAEWNIELNGRDTVDHFDRCAEAVEPDFGFASEEGDLAHDGVEEDLVGEEL